MRQHAGSVVRHGRRIRSGAYRFPITDAESGSINRLPEKSNVSVIIITKKADERLLQAVKMLRIRKVSFSDVAVDFFWSTCESHAEVKSPISRDRIKMVSVNWQLAEAAIPAFQKMPNLEEILILAASRRGDDAKARETLGGVQKALPKVEAHLIFFDEK